MTWKITRRILQAPLEFWDWRSKAIERLLAFRPADNAETMLFATEIMVDHGVQATEAWRPLADLLFINDWLEETRNDYLLLAEETRAVSAAFGCGQASRQELGIAFWHFTATTMWNLSTGTRALRGVARIRHEVIDAALQGHARSTVCFQEQLYEAMLGIVSPENMFRASHWHLARSPDVLSRDYNIAYALKIRPSPQGLISRLMRRASPSEEASPPQDPSARSGAGKGQPRVSK
jgi:hypothetical protein